MRKLHLVSCMIFALFCSIRSIAQPMFEKGGYALEAENFFLQATSYHDSGQLDLAAEYYLEVVNANPTHSKALFNLALVQYDLGNFSKSAIPLEKLMELDPTDKGTFELYGLTQYQLGHYDQAIAAYDVALEAGPSDGILVNKALAFAETGRPKAALQNFDEALRLNPSNFNACQGKGIALMELGQQQLAITWFNQALDLRPGDELALSNRAIAYFSVGEISKAMNDFSSALSRDRNSEIYLARARCQFASGNLEDAFFDAKEASLLAPNTSGPYKLIGEIEWKRGNPQAAIDNFEAAMDYDPECTECCMQLAQIYLEEKQYYDAIGYLYQLLKMAPLNEEARTLLHSAYSQLDRFNLDQMARSN